MQVEAAPLQGLGKLPGVVGGEHDHRLGRGLDGPELGNRDLKAVEDFEEKRLGLHLDSVDLVDEQHDRLRRAYGVEQWPGQQEGLAEDVRFEVIPHLPFVALEPQQLLVVVPFVEGPGFVEPFVALKAYQPASRPLGERQGEGGLSHSCRPLGEDRFAQPLGQEDHLRDAGIGEVAGTAKLRGDIGWGFPPEGGHRQRV